MSVFCKELLYRSGKSAKISILRLCYALFKLPLLSVLKVKKEAMKPMDKKIKTKIIMGLIILVAAIILTIGFFLLKFNNSKHETIGKEIKDIKTNNDAHSVNSGNTLPANTYDPKLNPEEFSSSVTNKYFTLIPGKKMVYEARTEEGTERIEVYVMDEKKIVMGIETIVVWDRVWLNNELIEDTKDWYAQDKEGNVWYFGEDTAEMIDGKIINHNGAWEAGVDGALPGIIMKANPFEGETYRQEYYKGIAEDMADVLSSDENVSVPFGKLKNCLKTYDYTPLDPSSREHKYYCPDAGGAVLEINLDGNERTELISVEYGAKPSDSKIKDIPETLDTEITEEKAKEIALSSIPGRVTDIGIERKYGKLAYVVEINADNGPETDVVIDINTGEILGIET